MSENYYNKKNEEITTIPPNRAQISNENNTNTNQSSTLIDCFWSDNTPQFHIVPTPPTSPTPDNNVIMGAAVAATTAGRIIAYILTQIFLHVRIAGAKATNGI